MQSHMRKVHACLAVNCHLHFGQNERDILRATAVPRGWNWYRHKCQHRKLTMEKKILPPLLPGLEPATFRSRIRRSNHWAIPVLWRSHWVCLTPSLPPACTISGLNDAGTCLQANSIFSGPITSIFNSMLFDGDPFAYHCNNNNKKVYGFQISHFYGSFSNDTTAMKGLIVTVWKYKCSDC